MTDSLVEIADEVKHLTASDIDELYQRYINGEKNSVLISEYKIDINPNKLIKVLPPQQLLDTVCPYCQTPMYVKRKSKSDGSYKKNPIECYKCNHKIFDNSSNYFEKKCGCTECVKIEKQEIMNKKNTKREVVEDAYCILNFRPVSYESLGFREKLLLLTLFRIQTDEDFEHILSLNNPLRTKLFTPSDDMDESYIDKLYRSNILLIDPLSPLEAFPDEAPDKGYYPRRVQWIVNVAIHNGERSNLNEVYNQIYFDLNDNIDPNYEDDFFKIILELSIEEALQYLYIKTEELNITFNAEKKTKEVIQQLLENFSISEIYYFIKKSVEDAHIFYTKGYAQSKKHAGNIIPGKMLSLGERALQENWSTYKYNRDSRAPRSYLSQIIFDFLLKDEDAGFKKPIGKYWQQELIPKYFSFEEEAHESTLHCIECNSKNVKINMNGSKLSLDCEDCGFKKDYISEN